MIKLLLVDFDGVMSQGRFYAGHPEAYVKEFAHLQKILFEENRGDILKLWMRGRIGFREIHKRIAQEVGINPAIYDVALTKSVKSMKLNEQMLKTVYAARGTQLKVALFTDNMDIFDEVSVKYHALARHFDAIYSSSQHGRMKVGDDSLFVKACEEFYKEYAESHVEFTQWLSTLT